MIGAGFRLITIPPMAITSGLGPGRKTVSLAAHQPASFGATKEHRHREVRYETTVNKFVTQVKYTQRDPIKANVCTATRNKYFTLPRIGPEWEAQNGKGSSRSVLGLPWFESEVIDMARLPQSYQSVAQIPSSSSGAHNKPAGEAPLPSYEAGLIETFHPTLFSSCQNVGS